MNSDTLNLLLSLAGLVLGFVSAYNQIKSFAIRSLRLSGEMAKRWIKGQEERTALFLAYPSAFLGFVVNRVAIIVFLFFLSLYVPAALRLGLIAAPEWLASVVKLIPPVLTGLLLGALTSASSDVFSAGKKARTRNDN